MIPNGVIHPANELPWHMTHAYHYKQGVIWTDHNCVLHTDTIYAQYNGMEYKAKSIHSAKCWISLQMRSNT
jgi:hypothetical protein